jgi:parallel beta-helix repeat protein
MDFTQPKESIFSSALCAAFFFLWGGLLTVNPAMAANITVCPSGCDYTAIQAGIDMASSGDTVLVGTPGRVVAETYSGNFAMKSGVDVKSEGDDSNTTYTGSGHTTTAMVRAILTVIHGDGSDSVVRFSDNMTADVALDGFIIENVTAADTYLIRISGSPTIKNNIIRNNTGSGHSGGIGIESFVSEPADPLIENNLIHDVNGPGIGNGENSNATIINNEIWDCNGDEGPGIGLWGYAYPNIENNVIFENARAGIGANNPGLEAKGGTLTIPVIKGNIISNNGDDMRAGIHLERAGGDTGTINVTIGDNETALPGGFSNEIAHIGFWRTGIRLDDLTNVTIENNYVHNHFLGGISLGGVTNATIRNNETSYNRAGIQFDSNCINATVESNQIHDNSMAGIRNGLSIMHSSGGVGRLIVRNNNNIYSNSGAGISIINAASTNTIQGNTIHNNIQGGIFIDRASAVTVEGNQIYSNGYGGIYDEGSDTLSVNGTDIYDNHYGGIQIKYNTGTGSITHNTISQNHRGGIGIKTPCTFEISENQINNNLRGGIHTGDQSADGGGYTGAPGSAVLTIKKNKVYSNGQSGYGGGIDVRHAGGTIYNNLVYGNQRSGIRFGDNITEIVNNTVVSNGTNATLPGAGIVYDDLAGDVNAEPGGYATTDIPIKNNICTNNVKAGIRINIDPSGDCPANRDYNLLCQNNGMTDTTCPAPPPYFCEYRQLYMCPANANEIIDDPLFTDPGNDDYTLQGGSPGSGSGESGVDMGAYGGSDPMTW